MQKIAHTLNVEVYEFFRFEHKKPKDALIKEMNELFINAPDEKIEIIYKIVTTLLVWLFFIYVLECLLLATKYSMKKLTKDKIFIIRWLTLYCV